ncbi:MAG: transcriptional regulator [Myxococcaceae bacterium]|nr:transcriptional regulator [Myxococcaceae bacterium]
MELAAGDRVVYPNQGVCRVTTIDEKEVAGQKLVFVSMQREEDGARVMVPKQKLESIGVRKISSPEEVQKIFAFLRADTEKADLDWKVRARTNLDRMTGGGLQGLAEVVKGLQVLSELRALPTKERELYDNARHLLVAEISAALDIPECNAEDAIDIALFPPGKERPKRTPQEFARGGAEDEDIDLGDDVLGLEGADLGLPEEAEAPEEEEAGAEAEGEEAAPAKKSTRAVLSDDEETVAAGAPLPEEAAPVKRKRGRAPKPKPAEGAEPAPPKKRGRPPKPKPPVDPNAPPPKKRGRPPKSAAAKAETKSDTKKKKK